VPETIYIGRLISLQEVCGYPSMKRHTVMCWLDLCGMLSFKVGKLWRFKNTDIGEWVEKGDPPMSGRL